MPKPNTDGGFRLPGVVDPPRRCVQLQIPDDIGHIVAFWGALETLQYWFSWERDDDHTGALLADVWKDVLAEARALFDTDNPCPCEADDMTDCCEPILAKLDTIIGILSVGRKPDPILQINFRQDISNIISVPGWTVDELHPSAPDESYTEGTGDLEADLLFRQNALCHLLYVSCVTLMQSTRQSVLLAGLNIGIELFLSGWWLPATAVGIGSIIAGGLVTEALGDEEAIKDVICCMADELLGMPTTQENLINAARACEVGGNQTLIGEALAAMFADEETWAALVHDLGAAYDKSKHGMELYCPCTEDEGVICTTEGTTLGIDLPYAGGSGWTPDSIGGTCASFGHILEGGGDFLGSSAFCLETVQLQRFFGGTSSGEALYARVVVNGRAYYEAIEPNVHCTVTIDPHQVIDAENGFRIDLLGGGERMCFTGVRFTGKAIT